MTDEMTQGQYASVNGLNLYYETHGTGKPLVLLHGGQSRVSLTQDNNVTEEERADSERNWGMMLAGLKQFVEQ